MQAGAVALRKNPPLPIYGSEKNSEKKSERKITHISSKYLGFDAHSRSNTNPLTFPHVVRTISSYKAVLSFTLAACIVASLWQCYNSHFS